MAETQKTSISKDVLLEQIMFEVNAVPLVYLKTLYAIIHSFKENISTIQPTQTASSVTETISEEDFDWDSLLNDIHTNRKKNNLAVHNRLQELTD